ncbi:hypothetical protein N8I77_008379 [Diaporthe amygdali]|uniref:Clr5 domain-containing protein n=1 Tax=Phomopsis amygdali TaxID=1214568 RepID=A0AAD9SF26_PHOAM|nr:hypothetical protein N8I77_008379 [Diaporthe amygdali]
MTSTTRKIAPGEWERHKNNIIELYGRMSLKNVREEMRIQHGFDASSWQYEVQFKRWGIRKNATRNEWQQYFSSQDTRSVFTSNDIPGGTVSPVVLKKSVSSKKRASRWATGICVASNSPQGLYSLQPRDEAQLVPMSIQNEPNENRTNAQSDIEDLFLNVANAFDVSGDNFEPSLSTISTTSNLFRSPSQFLDGTSGSENFPNPRIVPFDALSAPSAPDHQFPCSGLDLLYPASISSYAPASNSTAFIRILKDANFRQKLPFAILEHNFRSKGIFLGRAAEVPIFGGFASISIAGILSSKHQSPLRRTTELQHFKRNLGSLLPGEESALVTSDQAFETSFARMLLFSMLNGFTGLNDVPVENMLRFLNRSIVNKLLLDILEQCPQYVSRTLADNIFRAAIEATNTNVVNLLLDRKLVDVNETVCHTPWKKQTPIERASELMSLNLMRSLIDAGADVNKFHVNFEFQDWGGALYEIIQKKIAPPGSRFKEDEWTTISSKMVEASNILIAAGARVHRNMMIAACEYSTAQLACVLSQHITPEGHQEFFRGGRESFSGILGRRVAVLDDRSSTQWVQIMISLCDKAGCNRCFVGSDDDLMLAIVQAARTGKLRIVQLLLERVDVNTWMPRIFTAAIMSQNHALIEFILSLGPDLDPPALDFSKVGEQFPTTPVAQAVKCGNDDLIRKLEAGGSLDRLSEGGRFRALVIAAASAGDIAYMKKLLARAVSSKQPYQAEGDALTLAMDGGHQEIIHMLLDAGAMPALGHLNMSSGCIGGAVRLRDAQMLRVLIASGAPIPIETEVKEAIYWANYSVISDIVHEYPNVTINRQDVQHLVRTCIETNNLNFFKEVLQTLPYNNVYLKDYLKTAVEVGHVDLIEYLLDMGVNPFDACVLEAAILYRADLLRLLFRKDRPRQAIPKCIGTAVLRSIIGDSVGNTEALDELLKTGTINFMSFDGDFGGRYYRLTPLGLAIQGSHEHFETDMAALEKFLRAGADPNGIVRADDYWTKGSPIMTALTVAVETGREDAVKMLLDYGADVNARPRLRTTRTALQYSAELGNVDMVRLLLSHGADVNSTPPLRGGATALQFAAISGNCNMVADLMDVGAQLGARPSKIDGRWPLEGAAEAGRLDTVRFLWELNMRAVAAGMPYDGFSQRQCLRAMNFARLNGHIGCRDLVSNLSGIPVEKLETEEYGAPWIAY